MRAAAYCSILCCLFFNSNALNCKTAGGPNENELKKLYSICVKQQNKNNSNIDGNTDQDWRESQRYNRWSGDNVASNRRNTNDGYGMEDESKVNGNRMNNRDKTDERHKASRQDDNKNNNNNDRMQHGDRDGDENMYSRNARGERKNRNGDNKSQRNNGVDVRNDFFQNENFDGYNNNQYSTQPSRRYKRERRIEVNSGKRSQYNPNPQRFSGNEEKYKEGKNSSKNNSTSDYNSTACAVHCLLESLKMTDENGMPDRYLVTHTITKDAKDEDLKDFLQEAIEECFQILNNENTDDKCEFSKNLLICLSEKGRHNCDDWKDDFQF